MTTEIRFPGRHSHQFLVNSLVFQEYLDFDNSSSAAVHLTLDQVGVFFSHRIVPRGAPQKLYLAMFTSEKVDPRMLGLESYK